MHTISTSGIVAIIVCTITVTLFLACVFAYHADAAEKQREWREQERKAALEPVIRSFIKKDSVFCTQGAPIKLYLTQDHWIFDGQPGWHAVVSYTYRGRKLEAEGWSEESPGGAADSLLRSLVERHGGDDKDKDNKEQST